MEKKTVIANIRAELDLSETMRAFLSANSERPNAWFTRDGGDAFLAEMGFQWNEEFRATAQRVIEEYFRSVGLPENQVPQVEITDSRRGSWIMEAALTLFGTVGTTYTILKGVSELPKLADGLEDTKKRLTKELNARFKKLIPERIEPMLERSGLAPQLPAPVRLNPITVSCTIDARPMRSLTPDAAKSHSIHLAVSVSRSALAVENLGDVAIENLRIGLFRSTAQRHSWSFGDAFSKSVPRLSGKQSTSLSIDQFTSDPAGEKLDLTDPTPLFVDCWLQDNSGIYLFNFFLE